MFQRYFDNLYAPPRRSLVDALIGDHSACNSSYPEISSDDSNVDWTWDVEKGNDFVDTLNGDRDVTFHRKHSSGTAVVRGSQPMSQGQHFWEIEMISPVYGTDMMVGIGTPEADMSQLQNTFISRLGKDNHTWGLSYTGSFYHNGEERAISTAFDQGSIIGLHLDLWNGTLSYYKNKKHLGIASRGLKGKTLYAMASSTAACSSMRLRQTYSFPSSLQFLCCMKLRDLIPDDKCVLSELDLPPGLKLFLENNLSWLLSPRCTEKHPHKEQVEKWFSRRKVSDIPSLNTVQKGPGYSVLVVGNRGLPYTLINPFRDHTRAEISVPATDPQPHETADESRETVDESAETTDESSETDDEVDDMSDDQEENECKRRKHSYNYAMGLSDPDSESEM